MITLFHVRNDAARSRNSHRSYSYKSFVFSSYWLLNLSCVLFALLSKARDEFSSVIFTIVGGSSSVVVVSLAGIEQEQPQRMLICATKCVLPMKASKCDA